MIDNAAIAQRAPLREHIDAATADFIARGGKIRTPDARKHDVLVPFTISKFPVEGERAAAEKRSRARGNAAARRAPKKPRTKRSDPQKDLAAFARRMLEAWL